MARKSKINLKNILILSVTVFVVVLLVKNRDKVSALIKKAAGSDGDTSSTSEGGAQSGAGGGSSSGNEDPPSPADPYNETETVFASDSPAGRRHATRREYYDDGSFRAFRHGRLIREGRTVSADRRARHIRAEAEPGPDPEILVVEFS